MLLDIVQHLEVDVQAIEAIERFLPRVGGPMLLHTSSPGENESD